MLQNLSSVKTYYEGILGHLCSPLKSPILSGKMRSIRVMVIEPCVTVSWLSANSDITIQLFNSFPQQHTGQSVFHSQTGKDKRFLRLTQTPARSGLRTEHVQTSAFPQWHGIIIPTDFRRTWEEFVQAKVTS